MKTLYFIVILLTPDLELAGSISETFQVTQEVCDEKTGHDVLLRDDGKWSIVITWCKQGPDA